MNHHQKTYAIKRLDDVKSLKLREADEKYKIDEVRLPDNKRLDLIYAGKVKLIPREDVNDYTDLADAYDFSEMEVKRGFKPEHPKLIVLINETAKKAKDQIMLGDCQEALKLIQELENIKI